MTVLLLLFQFWFLLFIWLSWLGLPKLCWIEVARVWEFHGGPVVRMQHFQCQVQILGQGTKIPQATWHGQKKVVRVDILVFFLILRTSFHFFTTESFYSTHNSLFLLFSSFCFFFFLLEFSWHISSNFLVHYYSLYFSKGFFLKSPNAYLIIHSI